MISIFLFFISPFAGIVISTINEPYAMAGVICLLDFVIPIMVVSVFTDDNNVAIIIASCIMFMIFAMLDPKYVSMILNLTDILIIMLKVIYTVVLFFQNLVVEFGLLIRNEL